MQRLVWPTGLGLLLAGCFSAELDPTIGDAFACEPDAAGACPEGMQCVVDRCQRDADVPFVEILSPSNGQDFAPGSIISLALGGRVSLEREGGEHVFGEGHVVIVVDGEEQSRLEAGTLAGTNLDIDVGDPTSVGAHRIAVELRRNDGRPYTHEGAKATRLIWARDEQIRVAIVTPWPGTEIADDVDSIDVTVSFLNFTPGMPESGAAGHIHVFSDEDVLACAPANDCSLSPSNYNALFNLDTDDGRTATGPLTLPNDDRTEITISAMLVTDSHNVLDPDDPTLQTGTSNPVFDEVVITRAAE
jgi:hypothetical protein